MTADPIAVTTRAEDEARVTLETLEKNLTAAREAVTGAEARLEATQSEIAALDVQLAAPDLDETAIEKLAGRRLVQDTILRSRRQAVLDSMAGARRLEELVASARREHLKTQHRAALEAGRELARRMALDLRRAVDQATLDLEQLRALAVDAATAGRDAGLISDKSVWSPPWGALANLGRTPQPGDLVRAALDYISSHERRTRATDARRDDERHAKWARLIAEDPERARLLLDATHQVNTLVAFGPNTSPHGGGRFQDSLFAEGANMEPPAGWHLLRSADALKNALEPYGGRCPRDLEQAFARRLQDERRKREAAIGPVEKSGLRLSSVPNGSSNTHRTNYAPPWRRETA